MRKRPIRQKRNHPERNLITAACVLLFVGFLCGIFFSKLFPAKPLKAPPIPSKPAIGVIALIIDDWGSGKNVSAFISSVDIPVAIAVLPKLPYSKTIAECAHANNKEVMLHLPMEPHYTVDSYPKDYIIKASMSPSKIKTLIDEFLITVPFAQGMNNHMGSKATEDKNLLKIIFSYFKQKDFFIVDSFVSEKSACEIVAKNLNLPFAKRDIFLDNKADAAYIEKQIAEMAKIAEKQGYVVGIGHARPLTLKVLKEQIPLLIEKGFTFVTVREVIEKTKAMKSTR